MIRLLIGGLGLIFTLLILKILNNLYFFYGIRQEFHAIHFRWYGLAFGILTAIILALIIYLTRKKIVSLFYTSNSKLQLILAMGLIFLVSILHYTIPIWTDNTLIDAINNPDLTEHFTIIDLSEVEMIRDRWSIVSQIVLLLSILFIFKLKWKRSVS